MFRCIQWLCLGSSFVNQIGRVGGYWIANPNIYCLYFYSQMHRSALTSAKFCLFYGNTLQLYFTVLFEEILKEEIVPKTQILSCNMFFFAWVLAEPKRHFIKLFFVIYNMKSESHSMFFVFKTKERQLLSSLVISARHPW